MKLNKSIEEHKFDEKRKLKKQQITTSPKKAIKNIMQKAKSFKQNQKPYEIWGDKSIRIRKQNSNKQEKLKGKKRSLVKLESPIKEVDNKVRRLKGKRK